MIWDAVLFDEGEKIGGRVAGQRGFGEMRIGGEEILRRAIEIGEVGAAAAGNEDFAADAVVAFENGDTAAAFTAFGGAEETGGTGAEDEDVELADGVGDGEEMVTEVGDKCCRVGTIAGEASGQPESFATLRVTMLEEARARMGEEEKAEPSPPKDAGFGMTDVAHRFTPNRWGGWGDGGCVCR